MVSSVMDQMMVFEGLLLHMITQTLPNVVIVKHIVRLQRQLHKCKYSAWRGVHQLCTDITTARAHVYYCMYSLTVATTLNADSCYC
jgi:hypothetical protein